MDVEMILNQNLNVQQALHISLPPVDNIVRLVQTVSTFGSTNDQRILKQMLKQFNWVEPFPSRGVVILKFCELRTAFLYNRKFASFVFHKGHLFGISF